MFLSESFFCFLESETFWVAVGALGTSAAVLLGVRQIRLSRLTTSADLLLRLEDRFDNEDFRETRFEAAKALKNITESNQGHIEDVLDFFETIGILVRKKVLNKELVWCSFFYWLHGYFIAGQELIKKQRKRFPSRYNELVTLHRKLLKIEKTVHPYSTSEWEKFLDEEIGETSVSSKALKTKK